MLPWNSGEGQGACRNEDKPLLLLPRHQHLRALLPCSAQAGPRPLCSGTAGRRSSHRMLPWNSGEGQGACRNEDKPLLLLPRHQHLRALLPCSAQAGPRPLCSGTAGRRSSHRMLPWNSGEGQGACRNEGKPLLRLVRCGLRFRTLFPPAGLRNYWLPQARALRCCHWSQSDTGEIRNIPRTLPLGPDAGQGACRTGGRLARQPLRPRWYSSFALPRIWNFRAPLAGGPPLACRRHRWQRSPL